MALRLCQRNDTNKDRGIIIITAPIFFFRVFFFFGTGTLGPYCLGFNLIAVTYPWNLSILS